MRSCLLLLAALLACGGSSPQSESVEQRPPASGDSQTSSSGSGSNAESDSGAASSERKGANRLLELFAILAKNMTAHVEQRGQDCPSFTKTLGGWLQSHGDEVRDLLILDHADEDHERIDESITETATVVVFGAAECGDSDAALTAYNEWDALVL
jgi:hypothetical protein